MRLTCWPRARTINDMASSDHRPLPDGLLLRPMVPADLEQIGELLTARGDPEDAVDHRLVVEDTDAGHEACAVVVDGDRVVSTAVLLDETVRIGRAVAPGTVTLPAGQVELVATDTAYEGRGLVRALMGWAHERSAERGHVLGVMLGIPYFYRLFGYEYAMAIPSAPFLTRPPEAAGTGTLRPSTAADLPAMVRLQDAVQADVDLAVPHTAPRWRWLLARDGSTLVVVEREGVVVATARVTDPDDEVVLADPAALDLAAAADLVAGVHPTAGSDGLRVQRRPGPVDEVCAPFYGEASVLAERYYVRLPDPAALLAALRPLLWQRHLASGLVREGRDLVLSTFGRHYRLSQTGDGFGPVEVGGPMQGPGAAGGIGCAPDLLADLLLGPLGMAGLKRQRPDVYPGNDAEWYEALFPPLTSDLCMFYVPY